jgi:hypothetical protein
MLICEKAEYGECGGCDHEKPHESIVDHLDEETNEEMRCDKKKIHCSWIGIEVICIEIEEK